MVDIVRAVCWGHKGGVYTIGFPQEGEANGNGTVSPGIALPGETPWRTITVGKTLAPIVETTVPFDVVKPLYPAKGEYTYGRGFMELDYRYGWKY